MMKRNVLILCSIVIFLFLVILGVHYWHQTRTFHAPTPRLSLISLGDSVAAGDGLPQGNTAQAALCHQSTEAYPYQVAQSLTMRLRQFACSGAQISVGILQAQQIGTQTVSAQLQVAGPNIIRNDVVITIGANDVGWNDFLASCVSSDCTTSANLASFQARLVNLQTELRTLLPAVAALHPHLVLINTYYSVIENTDTCLQPYGITAAKIQWVNAREASLNATIISAAQTYHDKYATITFAGHGICSSDPWIQGLSGTAPLHPNAAGQANIAALDTAQLR